MKHFILLVAATTTILSLAALCPAEEISFLFDASTDCPWQSTPIYEAPCDAMFTFVTDEWDGQVTLDVESGCWINACGQIIIGSPPDCMPGQYMPDCGQGCPFPIAPAGCLLIRIENDSYPACWLTPQQPVFEGQRIYLGINDAQCADNVGAFTGVLRVEPLYDHSLMLLEPGDGTTWNVGEVQTIQWFSTCMRENIRIELNRDYPNGQWEEIAVVPNTGDWNIYQWTVTGPVTTTARVRISGAIHPEIFSVSDGSFTIAAPQQDEITFVGSCNLGGTPYRVTVSGSYAYVSALGGGLRVVDISNPTAPTQIGFCSLPNVHAAAVSGSYAFVAALNAFYSVDISNPSMPLSVGSYSPVPYATGAAISGSYAYLPQSVLDISTPSSPQLVGSCPGCCAANGMGMSGDYCYIAMPAAALCIIDVSDPTNPTQVGICATEHNPYTAVASGGYAYVADNLGGLRIIDISDPASPQEAGFYVPPGNAKGIAVSGNRAYVAAGYAGLRVIDITNPASPTEVAFYSSLGNASGVTLSGGYIYVANADGSLIILSYGPPPPPPSIRVIIPNGGETWLVSDLSTIAWTSQSMNNENVHIEYNRGQGWWDIATVPNTGSCVWNVPGPASNAVRVRVTGTVHTTVSDQSDADFTIAERTVTVTSANGGESWFTEEPHDITWTSSYLAENVKIEINRLWPSGSWETITSSTPNDGSYSWLVSGESTSTARIRVSGIFHLLASDISDYSFTITQRSLTLELPNGDEQWWLDSEPFVTWFAHNIPGNINIELNRDYPSGTWENIGSAPAGDEIFMWTVTGPGSSNARIRISSQTYPTLTDVSEGDFYIIVPPSIDHSPHPDQPPGPALFVARVTDDQPGFNTKLFYQPAGAMNFDSLAMGPTGNPNEFSAFTPPLASGRYQYYLRTTDSQAVSVYDPPSGVYSFDLGVFGSNWTLCGDESAEYYNWAEVSAFRWAVKFIPPSYPFALSAARFAICPTCPDTSHGPVILRVYLADGINELPSTEVFTDTNGPAGNEIGGLPAGPAWVDVVTRVNGQSVILNGPFYVSIENVNLSQSPNAFALDTTGARCHASFFWDPCDQTWHNDDDAVPNARPGNRMIRANGFAFIPPIVVIYRSIDNIILSWEETGAPRYHVYHADTPDGPFETLLGSTSETSITDSNSVNLHVARYYQVVASDAP